MGGTVTQPFGCTGVVFEPPQGNCSHWHNGIDIVAPYGTAVHASGGGRVVYVGWNYADGADPAWIVIIAHSQSLHDLVRAHAVALSSFAPGRSSMPGQTIGYEGNTGHSTGAHLHWMVEFDGNFVNPQAVHLARGHRRGDDAVERAKAAHETVRASGDAAVHERGASIRSGCRWRRDDAWSSR